MTSPRPCTAEPELWFSTLKADVAKAVKICQACPLQAECAQTAVEQNIRWGTWGGLTEKQRQPRRKPSLPKPAECGTQLAFWRHRSKGETCQTCEAWHAAEVEADRRRRLDAEHAKGGGTKTGYDLHLRLKEQPCSACREVNRLACENARKRRVAARSLA
ncbi:WhiB family transcriptional regulator [Streptomyces gardneri]|uniref:WhiB family transcriptional regulator n=1 Tax=Streptomyces gardneri TaxID=66892 RepID=UPI0033C5EFB4